MRPVFGHSQVAIVDLIRVMIGVVGAAIGLWFIVPEVRFALRTLRSANWPVVEGLLQKGEVIERGATKFLQLPCRSLLGYRYSVNGNSYWGIFVVPAEDTQTGEKLQRQAEGKPVRIKYDPNNPSISIVLDKELLGRPIKQYPYWLD